MSRVGFIFIYVLALGVLPLYAEETSADEAEWGALPLALPIYTPDTGFMITGGGHAFYSPVKNPNRGRYSDLVTFFTYSQYEQKSVGVISEIYLMNTRLRIPVEFEAYDQPTFFWGVREQQIEKTKYTVAGNRIQTGILYEWFPDFYFGPMVAAKNENYSYEGKSGLPAGITVAGNENVHTRGGGWQAAWDTRDSVFYPSRGIFAELRGLYYHENFSGTNTFYTHQMNIRSFHALTEKAVIAFNFMAQQSSAGTPFTDLSRVGGMNIMRGYFHGRYIDLNQLVLQTEFRHDLFWRFSGVIFAAAGDVFSDLSGLTLKRLQYAAGLGLRFAINTEKRINFRLDAGYSRLEELNMYFTIKESF